MLLEEGTETSISKIVDDIYLSQGYEWKYIDAYLGPVYTRDNGLTYVIEDDDQFDVLEMVTERLKNEIILDSSKHIGRYEGYPYNLSFIVRHKS